MPAKAQRTISLADRAGRPFECSIPSAAAAAPDGDDGGASASGAEGDDGAGPSPASLLRSLEGSCLYRIEDTWWTYELCFERHVRQFHREAGGAGGGRKSNIFGDQ
mgnify:FL=1